MTVIFSKKCELALQAILFLSSKGDNEMYSADKISKSMGVPREFVSKVLQILTNNKIVGSRKGKGGGFHLAKPPAEIRLIDIVIAIDGLDIFHKCVLGFKGCSVNEPCPVHEKWGKLREETYKMLSEETLEQLLEKTRHKIQSIEDSEK